MAPLNAGGGPPRRNVSRTVAPVEATTRPTPGETWTVTSIWLPGYGGGGADSHASTTAIKRSPRRRFTSAMLPPFRRDDTSSRGCFKYPASSPGRPMTQFEKRILCIGAGHVGGPTMAMIAVKCPQYGVTVVDIDAGRIRAWQTDNLPIS